MADDKAPEAKGAEAPANKAAGKPQNKAAEAPGNIRMETRDGRPYSTSDKAEAEHLVRTRGYKIIK